MVVVVVVMLLLLLLLLLLAVYSPSSAPTILVLLRRGEGVEVSLHVAVGLCVELWLEGRQLLGNAKESPDLHAQDHPDDICEEGKERF